MNAHTIPYTIYRFRVEFTILNIILPNVALLLIAALDKDPISRGTALLVSLVFSAFLAWQSHTSGLKVSSQGLEYIYWPTYHIRCRWEDVEGLGEQRFLGTVQYVLNLRRVEVVGSSLPIRLRRLVRPHARDRIFLANLQGWPDGPLARQLHEHLPGANLFEGCS